MIYLTRFFVLFCVLFTFSADGSAQDLPTIFRDDFTTPSNSWPSVNNRDAFASIQNGLYTVGRRSQLGSWFLPAPVEFVDFNENFDIEIKARWIAGVKTDGYGISWAGLGAEDINNLVVTADGQYRIYRYSGRQFEELLGWQPSAEIKKDSAWNVITLKKRGSAINIVLNGYTIGSVEAPPIMGMTFGLIVNKSIKIEVDYFEVRQEQLPIRLAKDHPINVARENLGPNINSTGGDLSPVITADGRRLYIGRYPFKGNIGDPNKEDIYYSDLQPDGSWGLMKNQDRPLNNEGSNFLISITPDGNTVLVGNTYFPNGRPRGGGVSISNRTADGWQVPRPVQIDNYYNRNKFSEMSLDPSGTKLVMAIQRDDGLGEKDLYVSAKRPNGTFTEPMNMRALNSWGNEMSPFIAADGETIYFATDGRRGYGGVDIWMSRRLDDSWMNWSEPENLGPVVNTKSWDAYFTVAAKGDYAYLSATNDANNSADIYRVPLTPGVRPNPVVLVRGRVLDAKTKKPIEAFVEYESLTKDRMVGEARSEPITGEYAIALPAGDLYGFLATAKDYYPVSDQLDTRELTEYAEINRDLFLVPVKVNEIIRLNNLFFDSGESELRTESKRELDRLAIFLNSKGRITIELSGHTDNVGTANDNKILSQARVNEVRKYLITRGLLPDRMTAVGYGERKPISSNKSEEGRQKNRRVEFKIVSM